MTQTTLADRCVRCGYMEAQHVPGAPLEGACGQFTPPQPDTPGPPLPPSLAVTPNIPHAEQTLEQLRAERSYWDAKVKSAPGWGASVGAADAFLRSCDAWIARREKEAGQ